MKGLQQRVQDPPLQLRGEPSVCPGLWAPRPLLTQRGGGWPQDASECNLLLLAPSWPSSIVRGGQLACSLWIPPCCWEEAKP